jgi:hypothetical protein
MHLLCHELIRGWNFLCHLLLRGWFLRYERLLDDYDRYLEHWYSGLMHCVMQTNVLDGVSHNPNDLRVCALVNNVGDGDALCDKSNMGDGDDTNTCAPSTCGEQCSGMDATILANSPSRMVNASIPTMVPRTNHRLLGGIYIQAQ